MYEFPIFLMNPSPEEKKIRKPGNLGYWKMFENLIFMEQF